MRFISTFSRAASLIAILSTSLATVVSSAPRSETAATKKTGAAHTRPSHARISKTSRVHASRSGGEKHESARVFAAPGTAGMVVGRDPETGQLGMPTPEQIAELSSKQAEDLNFSTEGLIEEHHPDGSVSIDLQGRFREFSYARTDARGKLMFDCTDDYASILRAIKSSTPAPARLEEK